MRPGRKAGFAGGARPAPLRLCVSARILAALAGLVPAASSAQEPATPQISPWRQMLEGDLAFIRSTLENRYIYAVYPGGEEWEAVYGPASRRAIEAAAEVTDFAGYRAVLARFIGEFQDPHLRINLSLQPARLSWPGFTARYANGRLLVGASELSTTPAGAEIESCDGRAGIEMLDTLARLEGMVSGLESTRDRIAPLLFADAQNPFFPRPQNCRIAGADVALRWSPIRADALLARTAPTPIRDVPAGLSDFARNGAWIRLPSMSPRNADDAAAYRQLIALGPTLRDREVIVFDVRGNGGGPYNWFMAILRALYGDDYANYHARERLRIRPVFVAGTLSRPARTRCRPTRRSTPWSATSVRSGWRAAAR